MVRDEDTWHMTRLGRSATAEYGCVGLQSGFIAYSQSHLQDIVQETHSQITDDLLEFLSEAYIPNSELLLPCTEIPTALVVG